MLSPTDRAKLVALAKRAANHPMDMRVAAESPAKAQEFSRTMDTLWLKIGTIRVMFVYECMPPTFEPMRHLSISDAGKRPSDELFLWIADVVGMGTPDTWHPITQIFEQRLAGIFAARHAIKAHE